MNDSREWATRWLADLVGPEAPGMTRPVVVHLQEILMHSSMVYIQGPAENSADI